jgi:hypothetical protein
MPAKIAIEELRNHFRAAQRMPQLLECRDLVRTALRQTRDDMDSAENGDGDTADLRLDN